MKEVPKEKVEEMLKVRQEINRNKEIKIRVKCNKKNNKKEIES